MIGNALESKHSCLKMPQLDINKQRSVFCLQYLSIIWDDNKIKLSSEFSSVLDGYNFLLTKTYILEENEKNKKVSFSEKLP